MKSTAFEPASPRPPEVSNTGADLSAHEPPERLSTTTLLLHWLVGLAVIGMLAYGYWLQTLPSGPPRTPFVQIHKSFGLLVFLAALARIAWRWREGFPKANSAHRLWERRAALSLQLFMITATIVMPLTGIGRSLAYARPVQLFGWPVIPKLFETKQETLYTWLSGIHDATALLLTAALAIHVGAALKHHVIDRDDTLRRIFGLQPRMPPVPRI